MLFKLTNTGKRADQGLNDLRTLPVYPRFHGKSQKPQDIASQRLRYDNYYKLRLRAIKQIDIIHPAK